MLALKNSLFLIVLLLFLNILESFSAELPKESLSKPATKKRENVSAQKRKATYEGVLENVAYVFDQDWNPFYPKKDKYGYVYGAFVIFSEKDEKTKGVPLEIVQAHHYRTCEKAMEAIFESALSLYDSRSYQLFSVSDGMNFYRTPNMKQVVYSATTKSRKHGRVEKTTKIEESIVLEESSAKRKKNSNAQSSAESSGTDMLSTSETLSMLAFSLPTNLGDDREKTKR